MNITGHIKNKTKTISKVSLLHLAGILLLFATNIVCARILDVKDFGKFTYYISIASIVSAILSAGIATLMTREISKYITKKTWDKYFGIIKFVNIWIIAASIILYIFYIALKEIGIIKSETINISIIIIGTLLSFNSMQSAILRGHNEPVYAGMLNQALHPLILITGYTTIYYFLNRSLQNVVNLYLASLMTVFIIGKIILKNLSPINEITAKCNYSDYKIWRKSFASLYLIGFIEIASTQISILLLGILNQPEQTAYFRIAERAAYLSLIPFFISSSITGAYFSKYHAENNIKNIKLLSNFTTKITTLASSLITIVLIVFGKELITKLFGLNYAEDTYPILVILSISQTLCTLTGPSGQILIMTGNEKSALKMHIFGLINMILFASMLGKNYGALGVSLGVGIGMLSSSIGTMIVIKKTLNPLTEISKN